jgi:membrane protein YqaA with SNARE-associated domain
MFANVDTYLWSLAAMFVSAFGAATLLPLASEAVFVAQIKAGTADVISLFIVATLGNVAGSVFNWWLGLHVRRFETRRWFPFSKTDIDRAAIRFKRYGIWSLAFAWLPVIGDPLTLIAGVLCVPLQVFLPLVLLGKAARYGVLGALS